MIDTITTKLQTNVMANITAIIDNISTTTQIIAMTTITQQ
jgi:hypothetical protein